MEGIRMANSELNIRKRKQWNKFMETMELNKTGLDASCIYGLYIAFVQDKNLLYSGANVRKLLSETHKIPFYYTHTAYEFNKIKYFKIRPKLFRYLKDQTEEGEKARSLYRQMLAYKQNTSVSLGTVIKNSKDKEKDLKKDYTYDLNKDDPIQSKNLTYDRLIWSINNVLKTVPANKLLALSHVKKVYDTIKVPKNMKSSLDKAVRDAVYTISEARSIDEIKVYKKRFDNLIEIIKPPKKEKKK